MKNIRLAKMEKMIIEKKIVTLKELQNEFNISMNTVRRDVNELIENVNIKKYMVEYSTTLKALNLRILMRENSRKRMQKN